MESNLKKKSIFKSVLCAHRLKTFTTNKSGKNK